jgi:hypothetical protein
LDTAEKNQQVADLILRNLASTWAAKR